MMTRTEHVEWAKERARAELAAGSAPNALASIVSDLGKHPETEQHAALELGGMLALGGFLSSPAEVRDWIDGIS